MRPSQAPAILAGLILLCPAATAARRNGQADPARLCRVWFDDVVLATEYIGPIRGGKKP